MVVDVPVGVSAPLAAVLVDGAVVDVAGSVTVPFAAVLVDVALGVAVLLDRGSELPLAGRHLHRYSPSPVAVHLQSKFAGNCA